MRTGFLKKMRTGKGKIKKRGYLEKAKRMAEEREIMKFSWREKRWDQARKGGSLEGVAKRE